MRKLEAAPIPRPQASVAAVIANNPDRPVNSRQIADYFQVTTRTLATWRAEGRIPYWKINPRNFRYRIRDCETALSLAGYYTRSTSP